MKTTTHLFHNTAMAIGFVRGVLFVNDSYISIAEDANDKIVSKNTDPETRDSFPVKVVTEDNDGTENETHTVKY
jgi:hypothetical protein